MFNSIRVATQTVGLATNSALFQLKEYNLDQQVKQQLLAKQGLHNRLIKAQSWQDDAASVEAEAKVIMANNPKLAALVNETCGITTK